MLKRNVVALGHDHRECSPTYGFSCGSSFARALSALRVAHCLRTDTDSRLSHGRASALRGVRKIKGRSHGSPGCVFARQDRGGAGVVAEQPLVAASTAAWLLGKQPGPAKGRPISGRSASQHRLPAHRSSRRAQRNDRCRHQVARVGRLPCDPRSPLTLTGVAVSFSASRLTCYALLSALEEDMRAALVDALPEVAPADVVPTDVLAEASRRLGGQVPGGEKEPSLVELLPYVDYADAIKLLNRHKAALQGEFLEGFAGWKGSLERLAPIRNRVAHTRPLEVNDLPFLQDLARDLARRSLAWPSLADTLSRLEADPSFVLNLDIRFPDVDPQVKRHNLPLPDFDETGLLGRGAAEKSLLQALLGPYPVVSIVGDGGLGKTALAVKVAYELLDDPNQQFDAVVWTTAKAKQLTNTEVTRIEGAIQDSLGMFSAAARELAGPVTVEDPLAEVLSYMESFRILLILDNLETVLDARLRDFLSRLPRDSKVLITSRIGLGSLEWPYKLNRLEDADGAALLRATAKSRGLTALARSEQGLLKNYSRRMKGHPLYLKWFVSVVQAGGRPEDALADSSKFLDFCMSNVYEYLSEPGRAVLRSLQALPGRHSQAELSEVTLLPVDDLQKALALLVTTNFVNLQTVDRGGALSTEYEVTEFARVYLDRRHPLGSAQRQDLVRRHERLLQQGVRLANANAADPHDERSLRVSGTGDVSVASRLLTALSSAERGDGAHALSMVREAQLLQPEYHEAYRFEALIHDRMGDLSSASDAYERAMEHAAGDALCQYHAGRFFLRRGAAPERGLTLLQEAARTRRDDQVLRMEIARAHLQCGDQQSAFDAALSLLSTGGAVAQGEMVGLALRAGNGLAHRLIDSGDTPRALERIEEMLDAVGPVSELGSEDNLIRLAQTGALLDRARAGLADAYHARVAERLSARLLEGPGLPSAVRHGTVARKKESFGFLRRSGAGDLFFGRRSVQPADAFDRLQVGDEIAYEEGKDLDGRPCAVRVFSLQD